jgi:hypothetical protein
MHRKALLAAALALPLVVIAIGIVRGELHLAGARRWTFEVGGYDPRDLLKGRYLAYRLVLNEEPPIEECGDPAGEDCCLCLFDQGQGVQPRLQRATCATARERCDGMLRLSEVESLRRYYIPEADAQKLTEVFQQAVVERRAHLVVAIDADGRPRVDRMLIDGEPLERAIRKE